MSNISAIAIDISKIAKYRPGERGQRVHFWPPLALPQAGLCRIDTAAGRTSTCDNSSVSLRQLSWML